MNEYWEKFFTRYLGKSKDIWSINDFRHYPIGCTSDTHKYTVVHISYVSLGNEPKGRIFIVTKEGRLLDDTFNLKKLFNKQRKESAQKTRKNNLNWKIVDQFQKFPFVSLVWPAKLKDKTNISEITFKDFTPKFQKQLFKFLEMVNNK